MAKDTSNKSSFKTRLYFNEQVNFILLIMFMAVAIIITIKGCDGCLSPKENLSTQTKEGLIPSDSLANDSVLVEKTYE